MRYVPTFALRHYIDSKANQAQGYPLYVKGGFHAMQWVEFKTSSGQVIRERAMLRPAKGSS
jgi:hypothetical protein